MTLSKDKWNEIVYGLQRGETDARLVDLLETEIWHYEQLAQQATDKIDNLNEIISIKQAMISNQDKRIEANEKLWLNAKQELSAERRKRMALSLFAGTAFTPSHPYFQPVLGAGVSYKLLSF